MSYSALGFEYQRLCRALAGHPGAEFDITVISDALDIFGEDPHVAVENLCRSGSAVMSSSGMYALTQEAHEAAREHALRADTAEERDSVVRRMLGSYLEWTADADLCLGGSYRQRRASVSRRGESPWLVGEREAAAWFQRSRVVVLAGQREAVSRGWHGMVCDFAEVLWAPLGHGFHLDDLVTVQRWGIESAQQGDHPLESLFHARCGWALQELGRHHEAAAECGIALDIATANEDLYARSVALEVRARGHAAVGQGEAAVRDATEALALDEERGAGPVSRAFRLRARARGFSLLADHDRAIADATTALSMMPLTESMNLRARALITAGQVYLAAGHPQEAAAMGRQALPLIRDDISRHYVGDVLCLLAEASARMGDKVTAGHHFRAAREEYRHVGAERRLDHVDHQVSSLGRIGDPESVSAETSIS